MNFLDIEPEEPATIEVVIPEVVMGPAERSIVADAMAKGPVLLPGEAVPPPTRAAKEHSLARRSYELDAAARLLTITDRASYVVAGDFITTLDTAIKEIEHFFDEDISRAYATWRGLTQKRALYRDPLKKARDIVAVRYAAFERDDRLRAEADRKQRELAAQRDEQERLRAEAEQKAADAKQLADAAERASSRDEGLALHEQADAALAESDALKLEAAIVQAPVLPLERGVPEDSGPAVRAKWQIEVTDKKALISAVAAGKVSLEALDPNDSYLRKRAQADKTTFDIPGVRAFDAGTVMKRPTTRRP